MKIAIFFICAFYVWTSPITNDPQKIKASISEFADAVDQADVKLLEGYLARDFRVVMNRMFGSEEVTTLSRQEYLDMISAGKLGGAERRRKIADIKVVGNVASAKVEFRSTDLSFTSFYSLVKTATGDWLIVSDLPAIVAN